MADIFGDVDLFTEFDKERPPSDKILKQKFDDEFRNHGRAGISNGSCDAQTAACERRCYADDMPDSGVTDTAECGDNANFASVSKLKHLENEVRRLTALNIFFDNVHYRDYLLQA